MAISTSTGSMVQAFSMANDIPEILFQRNIRMLISIGILAWNEESVIENTLSSLFRQSAFQVTSDLLSEAEWEIIVVPNGCSDGTAAVARRVLAKLVGQAVNPKIAFAVHELKESGKSNAWNHFIHEYSSKQAELILMIDADIEFGELETISNTVKALLQNPRAVVAVDQPLKDVVKKTKKTLLEWFSVTASSVSTSGTPGIAGSFFCARTEALRQIWMPKGLSVEDGFLRAMIVTDCFRSAADEAKIIRAENASHYYETLTSFRAIFRHELRMVIGTAVNCYLTWDFLLFATDPSGPGAGVLIRNKTEKDPSWYPMLIDNSIKNHGFWVLPRGMLFSRFSRFKRYRGLGLVKCTLVVAVGFLLDLPVFIAANRRLKKGGIVGYW
jgi:glycosyltransferase involved in cell wall biosynthesis